MKYYSYHGSIDSLDRSWVENYIKRHMFKHTFTTKDVWSYRLCKSDVGKSFLDSVILGYAVVRQDICMIIMPECYYGSGKTNQCDTSYFFNSRFKKCKDKDVVKLYATKLMLSGLNIKVMDKETVLNSLEQHTYKWYFNKSARVLISLSILLLLCSLYNPLFMIGVLIICFVLFSGIQYFIEIKKLV